jgi:NAD(P)-dependent dehydrogenase (short-subunit alcohol dehydrogenase family)
MVMNSRAILVTGGTGALGSAIVSSLAGSTLDLHIVANFHHDQKRAKQLQDQTGCAVFRADVGNEKQVATLFESLPSPLFAVIHAAGISRDALLLRQSRADWEQTLRVNLDGTFLVVREALKRLQDGGRLIFLASRAGENGRSGQAAYAASKAGALALMKCAAREGAARRLAVNAVCPGFVPSAMNEYGSTPGSRAARRAGVFGELGSPSETAELVRWLLSEEAGAVSGQVLHCDSRFAV